MRGGRISRPSLARQRNTIKWHFSGPTLNAGLVAVIFQELRSCIARNPYIFVIFQRGGRGGGSGPPVPLPLDLHMTKDKMGIVSTSTQKPLIGYIGTNHLLIMLVQTIDWLYWYKPLNGYIGTNHLLIVLVQTID